MATKKNNKSTNKAVKKATKTATKAVKKAAKKNPAIIVIIIVVVVLALAGLGFLAWYLMNQDNRQHNHSTPDVPPTNIQNTDIQINFLELGNEYTGDSTFIKAGDVDILIDAGSRKNSATAIRSFVDKYCTDGKLEYVIATHAHQDHIAGFVGSKSDPGIFEKYEVGTIIDFNLTNSATAIYKDYVTKRDAEVASGAKHYTALDCWKGTNGGQKKFQITERVEMEILYQEFYENTTEDENDYSVCVMFNNIDQHYLFTGDLEAAGEKSLVKNNTLPKVQLFKGAHHGSYTANTMDLLNVIQPEVVCICCCAGSTEYTTNKDNTFPAQAAINRLGLFTENIYVTTVYDEKSKYKSLNGTIAFFANGTEYAVSCTNSNDILKNSEWFKANRTWPNS